MDVKNVFVLSLAVNGFSVREYECGVIFSTRVRVEKINAMVSSRKSVTRIIKFKPACLCELRDFHGRRSTGGGCSYF
jgi:hypothetical protein